MVKINHNDKLKIARKYKKQIADLGEQQDKLYYKALKELKIEDSGYSWDYFNNDCEEYLDHMFGGDSEAV